MVRDKPVRDRAIPNYGLSEGARIARDRQKMVRGWKPRLLTEGASMAKDRPSHYGEIVHSFKP